MVTMECLSKTLDEMRDADIDFNKDFAKLIKDYFEYSDPEASWEDTITDWYQSVEAYCQRHLMEAVSKTSWLPLEALLDDEFWDSFNDYLVLDVIVKLNDDALCQPIGKVARYYFQNVDVRRWAMDDRISLASAVFGKSRNE